MGKGFQGRGVEKGTNSMENITNVPSSGILDRIQRDLYGGVSDAVVAGVNEALEGGLPPAEILAGGLIAAMDQVGTDFRAERLYVPEVLLAARAMKAGMQVLKPRLAETGASMLGRAVVGTVAGDVHDIGKNLVAMMLEGAGFEVVDLGINQSPRDFLLAVQETRPQVLGMSALLTTTMLAMGEVIRTLEAEGLREDLLILVGGAPLNDAFASQIGADAYCRDASVGAEKAKAYLSHSR